MEENLDVIRKVVREILAAQSDLSKSAVKAEKKPRKPYTRRDLEAYERAKETNLMSRKLTNAIQHAEKLQRFREEDWVKLQESSLLTHPKLVSKRERLQHLFQPLVPIMEVDEPEAPSAMVQEEPPKVLPGKRRAEESLEVEKKPLISIPEYVPPPVVAATPRVIHKPIPKRVHMEEIEEREPEVMQTVMPPVQKSQQETMQAPKFLPQDTPMDMYLKLIS
jgi:hypothetical protein